VVVMIDDRSNTCMYIFTKKSTLNSAIHQLN